MSLAEQDVQDMFKPDETTNVGDFLKKLQNEIKAVDKKIEDNETLERISQLFKNYSGEDMLISSREIAERLRNRPDEEKIYSGFSGLDSILDGFRKKQLIVISAATKSGKTSFCIDLTSAMKDQNPVWIPFEESAEELVQKFLDRGQEPPHFYAPDRMSSDTLLWVEKKIVEGIAKFGSKVVFIDQLDFLIPLNGDNHALRVGQAMREIKRMAKQWDVTIFLICHLKQVKVDMQPNLEDLKGSSSIAQESDTTILLWRETKRGDDGEVIITDNVNVSVQANRRTGKTGNVKFVFENGKFVQWADRDPYASDEQLQNPKKW